MKNQKILVLGATGKVGGEVVRILNSRGQLEIAATHRPAEKSQVLEKLGVERRILDLDIPETLPTALEGIDRVLMLTGYTVEMMRQSKRFLDEARRQGVRHIVHIGASGAPTTEVPHWGWHQMVEAYIEKLGFKWTHLRPESYMQNVTGPGFSWLDGDQLTSFIGESRWSWVDAFDVAAVAAEVLLDPDKYHEQTIQLGYDAKTLEEVAGILESLSGRSIQTTSIDPKIFHDSAISGGMDPAYIHSVFTQFDLNRKGKIPESDKVFSNFERIVGRPPVTWEVFARKYFKSLAHNIESTK